MLKNLRNAIVCIAIFTFVLSLFTSKMYTAATSSANYHPNAYYKIINRADSKCVDNAGATDDGAIVKQYVSGSSYNQQWKFENLGTGYFKIVCRTGGKCLDTGGNTVDGSNIQQWGSGSSSNQQWSIQDMGHGYVKIINRATGKCLDNGGLTTDGSGLQQWGSGSSYNQQWQIKDVSTSNTAYLMTYFSNSNSAVYYGYSRDGLHWTTLNSGKPVVTSTIGTNNIRDPFTIRDNNGVYHILGTDNWSSQSIVVYDSTNLTSWTGQRLCNICPSGGTFSWAPEAMWDSAEGKYRVYFASNASGTHKMYSTLTSDFKTFSTPSMFYDPGNGNYAIDGNIISYNGSYNMFFKYSDPGPSGKGIQRLQATSVSGPWSNISGPLTTNDIEGPTVFKDNYLDKWYMYGDGYTSGTWVLYSSTNPSGTWTQVTSGWDYPSGARHGNIMPITEAELNNLLSVY